MKKWTWVLLLLLGAGAGQVWAWGADGHRITGYVAEALLTPEAKVQLARYLPAQSLAEVATWLDEERPRLMHQLPGAAKWHYDNEPICRRATVDQFCPDGNCAYRKITEYQQVLADPHASRDDKAFAIRVLVHLVGDLHQPLHAADNGDRGANDVAVGAHQNNLHREWDSGLLKRQLRHSTPAAYADDLRQRYRGQLAAWQAGGVADWAAESHRLAEEVVYGDLPGFSCRHAVSRIDKLPPAYVQTALPVIDEQLVKAGARIAYVLNTALHQR